MRRFRSPRRQPEHQLGRPGAFPVNRERRVVPGRRTVGPTVNGSPREATETPSRRASSSPRGPGGCRTVARARRRPQLYVHDRPWAAGPPVSRGWNWLPRARAAAVTVFRPGHGRGVGPPPSVLHFLSLVALEIACLCCPKRDIAVRTVQRRAVMPRCGQGLGGTPWVRVRHCGVQLAAQPFTT